MTQPLVATRPLSPGGIIDQLIGTWAIARRVDDKAVLTGDARFVRLTENEALYHERGTLRLSTGHEAAAERKYIFRRDPDGFAVLFDETPPRLFHQVKFVHGADGCLRGEARHLCANDVYLICYKFESDALFRIDHRVRGPRKDYTMTTVYRKIADACR